jgi:hypothetical protein
VDLTVVEVVVAAVDEDEAAARGMVPCFVATATDEKGSCVIPDEELSEEVVLDVDFVSVLRSLLCVLWLDDDDDDCNCATTLVDGFVDDTATTGRYGFRVVVVVVTVVVVLGG